MFIELGILAVGNVVLTFGVLHSPMLLQTFQCGYDPSLNNSSLTRDQISKYCNKQILETDINLESRGLTIVDFGIIFMAIRLIILEMDDGIWLIGGSRSKTIEALSASVDMENNREEGEGGRREEIN